jgi:hypothetical protein
LNKSDTPDRPLHCVLEEFGGGYLGHAGRVLFVALLEFVEKGDG